MTDHEQFKDLLNQVGLTYKSLAEQLGLSYESVRNQCALAKPLPRWAKSMLLIDKLKNGN